MSTLAAVLAGHLAARQRRNPSYSLRSFARDLNMNPGTVSAILKGQRQIPRARLPVICERLALSPRQRAVLARLASAAPAAAAAPDAVEVAERHFQILAEWEHFAVLSLLRTRGFSSDLGWIARRLGISAPRAATVVDRLLAAGFVRRRADGKLTRATPPLKTSEDVASAALRAAHAEELELARRALDTVRVELRDVSSMTLAMDPSRLPAAKALLRRFRDELATLVDEDGAGEVYQLCVQLFPLTSPALGDRP